VMPGRVDKRNSESLYDLSQSIINKILVNYFIEFGIFDF
jgi:hypothetical protein